jgi:outer membrane protein assembly factor BamB
VVQSRSPVVPISVSGANPVVYLGAQDGRIYTVDATQGGRVGFPWVTPPIASMVQAAPAGIFSDFDPTLAFDYLLVGTRDASADNVFVALDPTTGGVVDSFNNGGGANGIGIINGMAVVDYAKPPHVYFASHAKTAGGPTLWCQELTTTPAVFASCAGWTHAALGDIDSSPVIRGGRIYVGSGNGGGTVYSVDAASGVADRSFPHLDGQVKGFVFPDRGSDAIYFATDNKVWSFSDTTGGMMENFPPGGLTLQDGPRPSSVLFVPGSHYLYVGASNGRLYEIDLADLTQTWVQLGDGKAVVGAPSLDRENSLVHVGTEAGVFYAVSVPLSP